ncbi:MAG: DUF1294 domain-containing protein [Meiothermus sp.]|uniref:DUF1294 domain-containing protein n=1 Tax=Meiothermus sp. TaxID=1955249 RepID=UPI0025D532E3|nr:DUF1294 domain-containing protein [Meiothermus sp.]MCS7059338.1 DUF1294 domain-containing protein [Meiothermus sp.]MCS7194330.1 DUF1294 domain-containing protein [Meiothermus sp.]MCX7740755.1 DUF1294 domain-containing protein [Meiothermus sp.]MDW8090507.1 DUF1294 domain-containing protein [Meiothermus sp.]MDW8482158.1 DUF1294 domain-containing protein [Meiothermus sp.]
MRGAVLYLLEVVRSLAWQLLLLAWYLLQVLVGIPAFLLSLLGLVYLGLRVVPGGMDFLASLQALSLSLAQALVLAYLPMGLVTFFRYGVDKWRAVQNEKLRLRGQLEGYWRVPERQLHLMEFFGGWPGGLLAQKLFRHKSRKESFQTDFWLIGFFHLALVGSAQYLQNSWTGVALVGFLGVVAWFKACR